MKKSKENLKNNTRKLAAIIKHEGIKAKGFGIIPKFIMHDRDLTLESKAIYGYFSALCGSGNETFPSRNTILQNLKLSKNGYYEHYNSLLRYGYIIVAKLEPDNIKSRNVYTIVENPPKVDDYVQLNSIRADKKLLSSGINACGYGILPKAVMMDERLDIKAKGIYCYLASYAGAGETAFPEKKHILYHLNISETTYYKYYNQLINYNYIMPVQRREKGTFGVCDYILNQMPDESIGSAIQESRRNRTKAPNTKKEDIRKHMDKSPKTPKKPPPKENNSPNTRNEDIGQWDTRNEDTTNINASTNKLSTNRFIYQSNKPAPPSDSIDNSAIPNFNLVSKENVANNISLQKLLDESPDKHELINLIYDILCDTLSVQAKFPTVWVNRRNTPVQEVFNTFSNINKNHVEYVIFSCYNNDNLSKAKNLKAYVRQALLRSTLTLENFDSRKFKQLETRTPEQSEHGDFLHSLVRRSLKF